jgi:hypothetical protein
MYKQIRNSYTNEISSVQKEQNGFLTVIPFNESNTDYQAYLAWLDEGNTPEAAD